MKVVSRNGSYMFERKHQGFMHVMSFLAAWLPVTVVFLPFVLCSMYFFEGGLGGSSATLLKISSLKAAVPTDPF